MSDDDDNTLRPGAEKEVEPPTGEVPAQVVSLAIHRTRTPEELTQAGPLPATMSVWDALCWAADRKLRPYPGVDDWGHVNIGPTLEALEARASDAPHYLWESPRNGRYPHLALSPKGPAMLRRIRARLRIRRGCLVTYREAADMLRAEITTDRQLELQIERAMAELIDALRGRKLVAWGKRNAPLGRPDGTAVHDHIPAALFLDERMELTEWGTLETPFGHRHPGYSDVYFYTKDVLGIWRPPRVEAPKPEATPHLMPSDELGAGDQSPYVETTPAVEPVPPGQEPHATDRPLKEVPPAPTRRSKTLAKALAEALAALHRDKQFDINARVLSNKKKIDEAAKKIGREATVSSATTTRALRCARELIKLDQDAS
jgi:hypothetical protein